MGKSSKKAKSDRINALRKQYDAFLEEDKKRKERNEYILGRLDNMRYSTTLVPVRHKPNINDNRITVMQSKCSSIHDFQSSIVNKNQLTPDIQVNNIEDTFLIQEISKKYILIPKLRSTFMDNYIQNVIPNQNTEGQQQLHPLKDKISMADVNPNTNDNTDWKSKYEILNILKNEENKNQTETFKKSVEGVSDTNVNKFNLLRNNDEQVAVNYNNNINIDDNIETTNKYLNELPEKDDVQNYELKSSSEYSPNDITYASSNPKTYNENNKDLTANDPSEDIDFKLQHVKLDNNNSVIFDPSVGVTNNYEKQPEHDVDISYPGVGISAKQSEDTYSDNIDSTLYDQNVFIEHKSADSKYLDGDESPIRVENPSGILNEMLNDFPIVGDPNHTTKHDGLVEFGNVQELIPTENVQMRTDINIDEKVEGQPNVDSMYENENEVNTVTEPVIETVNETVFENQEDVYGSIADFEAEQREMFYSEQTDENYTHQPGDVNTFDPEYSQNENQQGQENACYGPIPQEVYPVEISDQEVTQQYDPYYAQQYANLDEGLDQQQYQQQPAQYQDHGQDQPGQDQPEPKLELQQYEQQNYVSQVEQVLDVEDGYIEQEQLAETFEEQHIGEAIGIGQPGAEEITVSEQVMG